jgi:hypothetical protein
MFQHTSLLIAQHLTTLTLARPIWYGAHAPVADDVDITQVPAAGAVAVVVYFVDIMLLVAGLNTKVLVHF